MKIWAIIKIGLKECLRQRVVYFIFMISLLFVFMAKGCDIGTVKGGDLLLGKDAQQVVAMGFTFNIIVFWSIMLCGLLASQALTRDMDEGVIAVILARPLPRESFIAGRLLPALIVSALNLMLLGLLFCWNYYQTTGTLGFLQPLSFLFMLLSLGLYGSMVCCLSLFIPKLLAPLAGIVVYIVSCWSTLPYYYENLKLFWSPSENIQRIHLLLPKFGDLQAIGDSLLKNQSAFELLNPLELSLNVVIYFLLFWFVLAWAFKRKEF